MLYRKLDSNDWKHADLSIAVNATQDKWLAAGDPSYYPRKIVYRGRDNHIHHIYQQEYGAWKHADLSTIAY